MVEEQSISKYDGITRLLATRSEHVVRLAWDAIDNAVGGLPASAAAHQAWWHGDRAQVRAWRTADYVLERVQPGVAVTFRRSTGTHSAAPPEPKGPPFELSRSQVQATDRVLGSDLGAIDPSQAVAVIPCSKRKCSGGASSDMNPAPRPTSWSPQLHAARTGLASAAQRDDTLLLPAWQRYTGTFYKYAAEALADELI